MNLNVKSWKPFQIKRLFSICAGKYYYKDDYSDGNTPYCSASAENNGVSKTIDIPPDFDGNKIITGKVGCTAFYQAKPFCATSDVNILTPLFEMSANVGLFITTVINKSENYRWNYGRQCRVNDTQGIVIKLPVQFDSIDVPKLDLSYKYSDDGYIPDWNWMDNYIKSLKHLPITTVNVKQDTSIDISSWKEFRLGDLFSKIYKAEAHIKAEYEIFDIPSKNTIRFVSRTENNNGCDCYIENNDLSGIEDGQAIVIGDTTATCSYQNDSFVCGDHIVICRADWINVYTGLFVTALIKREKYKYNYGRAFIMPLICDTYIKLPIMYDMEGAPILDSEKTYSDEGYIPDWEWMEKYIKSLPYGDRI